MATRDCFPTQTRLLPALGCYSRGSTCSFRVPDGYRQSTAPHRCRRFDKAGIPAPGFFAPLDGIFEIGRCALILAGLPTRLSTIPMIIDMIGAPLITKLPTLWSNPHSLPKTPGFPP
ncbi:DoxX family protein [Nocardia sp. NPDC052112]|uniref:DoxX family protein n=1 Tax=Nocardia sp. NPDC052112 TaxID=3155646 RepID=UPI003421E95B